VKPGALLVLATALATTGAPAQTATSGMLPDSPVLQISEADGQAQMGLQNTGSEALLLQTRIYDVTNDSTLKVVPLPPVIRVEAKARQIVRFILERPAQPMTVQHLRRVTFEGIPVRLARKGEALVQVNTRYDLPVIISPRGLEREDAPWTRLVLALEGRQLVLSNPSAYVVRMSSDVTLLPFRQKVEMLGRSFIMPGDRVSITLPDGIDPAGLTAVRIAPTTLYGFAAPDYDAAIPR